MTHFSLTRIHGIGNASRVPTISSPCDPMTSNVHIHENTVQDDVLESKGKRVLDGVPKKFIPRQTHKGNPCESA
jgi:hypothetical protein